MKNSNENSVQPNPSILVDPSNIEERYAVGDILISIDPNTKDIFSIYKRGSAFPGSDIMEFINNVSISISKKVLLSIRTQISDVVI